MPSTRRHPGFPARPMLHPGVRLCRREDGHLQLGLATHLRVIAPDTDEIRSLLGELRSGIPPGPVTGLSPAALRLCRDLLDKNLVLDAEVYLDTVTSARGQRLRESVSAHLAQAGREAASLLERRRNTSVQVVHRASRQAARRVSEQLRAAGVCLVDEAGRPDLGVLVSRGEADRDLIDPWVQHDVPHVVVGTSEGVVRAGPFVVPGRTACVRCIDAHHGDHDPRRALIVTQYAAAPPPRDGLPEPIHHDLFEMAVLWAARDVLTWVDGGQPQTWSTTITFDPALELRRTPWRPHPDCGCTWGQRLAV